MAFKSKLVAAFGTALAILVCVGALSYLKVRQDDEEKNWVDHTHLVIEKIASFQIDLGAAGTRERAYFTTGDQSDLDRCEEAIARLTAEFRELEALTLDNQEQQRRINELGPLVAARLNQLQGRVDLRKIKGAQAPAALAAAQPGSFRPTREQIDRLIADLKQEETRLLVGRAATASSSGHQVKVAIIGGYSLGLLFLLGAAVAVQHEMSRRGTAEKTFLANKKKFKALLQSAPDAMVIANQHGEIVLVNSQTERLFGYPAADLLNKQIEILIPERYRGRHTSHRGGFFSDPKLRPMGAGLQLHARRKDGTEFPVEISLSPLQTEEGMLVSSAIRDVTERKKWKRFWKGIEMT
jgi:PAS domain S-box-containing protein